MATLTVLRGYSFLRLRVCVFVCVCVSVESVRPLRRVTGLSHPSSVSPGSTVLRGRPGWAVFRVASPSVNRFAATLLQLILYSELSCTVALFL